MKIAISLLMLLINCTVFASQGNYSAVKVLSSNEQELVLVITPKVISFDTIQIQNQPYIDPVFATGIEKISIAGAPTEYVVSIPITVPNENGASINNISLKSGTTFSIPPIPIPTQRFINERHEVFYEPSKEYYTSTTTHSWAKLEYKGISRNRHISTLLVTVAQWNSTTSVTEIADEITVTIRFTQSPSEKSINNNLNQNVNLTLFDHTINGVNVPKFIIPEPQQSTSQKKKEQVFNSGRWCSFNIPTEGIYTITPSMLSNAGISVSSSDIASLKVYGNGGKILSESQIVGRNNQLIEQPIIVNITSSGELESIVFYACGPVAFVDSTILNSKSVVRERNTYINSGRYLLSVGSAENGLRTSPIQPTPNEIISRPTKYIHRLLFEEELRNAYQIPTGRRWFGRNIDASFPQTIPLNLPNLIRNDTIRYVMELGHTMATSGSIVASENGTTISTVNLSSVNSQNYDDHVIQRTIGFLPSNVIEPDQRSALRFSYEGKGNGFLDFFEIHYPRECTAINNEIDFFSSLTDSGATEYAFNGFSGKIYGFDVTDRSRPQEISNVSSIGGMFTIRQSFEKGKLRKYFLSSALKNPINFSSIQAPYLRSKMLNADVIVICHSSLTSSAENYKLFHKNSGKTIEIVTQEQIFNEFSYGQHDPTAIRDFLAFAYQNWTKKPEQVLLWGSGHYDYRNITTSNPIQVTTYMAYISNRNYLPYDGYGTMNVVNGSLTDDYFVRFLGNEKDKLPELSIARLPFRSNTEANVYLSKLELYRDNQSDDLWRSTAIIIADDGATTYTNREGDLHTNQTEQLVRFAIPSYIQSKKIYLVDYPNVLVGTRIKIPEANEAILQAVNENGGLFVNYTGHGSPRVWAHEEVFDRDRSIPLMTNKNKLFFMTGATCDFSRFDEFSVRSGAEELSFSSFGGAIGVLSASRVVLSSSNAALNFSFYTELFKKDSAGKLPTLGEAFFNLKLGSSESNDDKFYLLADPLIKLHIPEQPIQLDEINAVSVVDSIVPILSLSTVTVKGRILKTNETLDYPYNGLVNLSMFSSPLNDSFKDRYNNSFSVQRYGSILHKGAYPVQNGDFVAKFVIPKVTSLTNTPGQLYLYSNSQNGDHAIGYSNKFVVSGISDEVFTDYEGPKIDLYLDGRTFRVNDIVRSVPTLIVDLSDETGVNATGAGIGNKIQVWVNNSPKSLDITNTFRSSITTTGSGTATTPLFGLSEGKHSVRVRAWDVLNNFSENETFFQTVASSTSYISESLTLPNPVVDFGTTFFRFTHTFSSAFTAQVTVYASDGRIVKNLEKVISTLQSGDISWDRTDNSGLTITQGSYYYTISIQPFGSDQRFETMGNFIFSK